MALSRLFCCQEETPQQIAQKLPRKSGIWAEKYLDYIQDHYAESGETLATANFFIKEKLKTMQDAIEPQVQRAGELVLSMRSMSSVDAAVKFIKSHEENGYSLYQYFNSKKLSITEEGRRELLQLSKEIDTQYTKMKPVKNAIERLDTYLAEMALRGHNTQPNIVVL